MSYIQILREADRRFAELDAMTLARPDPAYEVVQALLAQRGTDLPESSVLWDVTVHDDMKTRHDVAIWILDDGNRLVLHEFAYTDVQSAQAAQA
jgi:hypothetical protein